MRLPLGPADRIPGRTARCQRSSPTCGGWRRPPVGCHEYEQRWPDAPVKASAGTRHTDASSRWLAPMGCESPLAPYIHVGKPSSDRLGDTQSEPAHLHSLPRDRVERPADIPAGGVQRGLCFHRMLGEVAFRNCNRAESVPRPGRKPCWPGARTPCRSHARVMRLTTMPTHSFRMTSSRMRGRRPSRVISASGSLGLGQSQPHCIHVGVSFWSQSWRRHRCANSVTSGGHPFAILCVSPVAPGEVLPLCPWIAT